VWTVLELSSATSAGGATLTKQQDGSILASGENPSRDTYSITANTKLTGITAIRLELLSDTSLPANGPGRAAMGCFGLHELRVTAAPQENPSAVTPVGLKNPVTGRGGVGGGPIWHAIDGDPDTDWSIFSCRPQTAVFQTQQPLGLPSGTLLTFTLNQAPEQHSIGRLRLSATAESPIPLPEGYGTRRQQRVTGHVPATAQGGTLVVSAELSREGKAMMMRQIWENVLGIACTVGGNDVPFQPVLSNKTYPVSWQAWRVAVEPSTGPQEFALSLSLKADQDVEIAYQSHFVPD
jgi:hypothetical protein